MKRLFITFAAIASMSFVGCSSVGITENDNKNPKDNVNSSEILSPDDGNSDDTSNPNGENPKDEEKIIKVPTINKTSKFWKNSDYYVFLLENVPDNVKHTDVKCTFSYKDGSEEENKTISQDACSSINNNFIVNPTRMEGNNNIVVGFRYNIGLDGGEDISRKAPIHELLHNAISKNKTLLVSFTFNGKAKSIKNIDIDKTFMEFIFNPIKVTYQSEINTEAVELKSLDLNKLTKNPKDGIYTVSVKEVNEENPVYDYTLDEDKKSLVNILTDISNTKIKGIDFRYDYINDIDYKPGEKIGNIDSCGDSLPSILNTFEQPIKACNFRLTGKNNNFNSFFQVYLVDNTNNIIKSNGPSYLFKITSIVRSILKLDEAHINDIHEIKGSSLDVKEIFLSEPGPYTFTLDSDMYNAGECSKLGVIYKQKDENNKVYYIGVPYNKIENPQECFIKVKKDEISEYFPEKVTFSAHNAVENTILIKDGQKSIVENLILNGETSKTLDLETLKLFKTLGTTNENLTVNSVNSKISSIVLDNANSSNFTLDASGCVDVEKCKAKITVKESSRASTGSLKIIPYKIGDLSQAKDQVVKLTYKQSIKLEVSKVIDAKSSVNSKIALVTFPKNVTNVELKCVGTNCNTANMAQSELIDLGNKNGIYVTASEKIKVILQDKTTSRLDSESQNYVEINFNDNTYAVEPAQLFTVIINEDPIGGQRITKDTDVLVDIDGVNVKEYKKSSDVDLLNSSTFYGAVKRHDLFTYSVSSGNNSKITRIADPANKKEFRDIIGFSYNHDFTDKNNIGNVKSTRCDEYGIYNIVSGYWAYSIMDKDLHPDENPSKSANIFGCSTATSERICGFVLSTGDEFNKGKGLSAKTNKLHIYSTSEVTDNTVITLTFGKMR